MAQSPETCQSQGHDRRAVVKVAVTGASGLVGGFVVPRLLAQGATVRALTRTRGLVGFPTVDCIRGDVADRQAVDRLVAGMDAVVHCAYQHAPGKYRGGEAGNRSAFWRANLLAGVELMERARRAAVPRLVLLSSRAVFGRASPQRDHVTDASLPVPDTHYGAMKLALEAHAAAFSATDGVCYASLRPTGVYGLARPVERSKWFDIAQLVRRPALDMASLPPPRRATEVHGVDVADAVWRLLTAPPERVAGRAFNCSDIVVDNRDVIGGLAARAGVRLALPPPATNPLRHQMRTPGLAALGWRPGGQPLLAATLDALSAAAKQAP